ncbi:MAG: class II aldolase/adducin family protein [Treponema sp.]|nr:class II aldolase/adducin family protein [Treponema sp.]
MNSDYQHPRDQIAEIMDRVYRYGMTTTSGGNLSVRDETGDIWITPGGTDKGVMRPADVVRMHEGVAVDTVLKPSSEHPFHRAIYETRADVGAILHAHPPALVAFSVAGKAPDTRVLPQAFDACGKVGFAPYAVPGSEALGRSIAAKFAEGCDIVVLENHGVVAAGKTLLEAFQRFETLEFCARTIINAAGLGGARVLSEEMIVQRRKGWRQVEGTFAPGTRSSRERELRRVIVDFVHRAYDRRLMTSTEGSFSARLGNDAFLITPYGVDRRGLEAADIALVSGGLREIGTVPSRATGLHRLVYADHPDVGAIVTAQCPYLTAFVVAGVRLDSRTIPESYINLRDMPVVPYGAQFGDEGAISAAITRRNPVVVLDSDAVLATGRTILEAYDRLEVAEATANALISARRLGDFRPIDARAVAEIEAAFNVPPA